MSKGQTLQDPFLNALRRERVPVSIYMVNGIQLQGTVESFDQFVVLLRSTMSRMVYKHAISRSEENTSELQSLMRISYAVFCLKKKTLDYRLNHKIKTK